MKTSRAVASLRPSFRLLWLLVALAASSLSALPGCGNAPPSGPGGPEGSAPMDAAAPPADHAVAVPVDQAAARDTAVVTEPADLSRADAARPADDLAGSDAAAADANGSDAATDAASDGATDGSGSDGSDAGHEGGLPNGCGPGPACGAGMGCCGGVCIDTGSDPLNCGGCNLACSTMNAVPACVAGACRPACAAGFGDCDGDVINGCETDLGSDARNCGACNQPCALPHANAACQLSACRVASCGGSFQDCNGVAADGCEVDTAADPRHCGTCDTACPSENGTPSCAASTCAIACTPGFGDCDRDVADGCETDLSSTLAHCGACGNPCAFPNAAAACLGAACQLGACNTGFGDCDADPADGCETNLAGDPAHCGTCGTTCALAHATAECLAGACQVMACAAGFGDCDGDPANGCETHLLTDAAHCGSCVVACSLTDGTPTCNDGRCDIACQPGFGNCDGDPANGCEHDLTADPANCGGCRQACSSNNVPSPTCTASACTGDCAAGYRDCDADLAGNGCEVHAATDAQNCGGCRLACSGNSITPACSDGDCTGTCFPDTADCDGDKRGNGCEVRTDSDPRNCGACNAACSTNHLPVADCHDSLCDGPCEDGYADCNGDKLTDGCETDATTITDCGVCGNACNTNHVDAVCQGGCGGTCAAGFGDCDHDLQGNGCESDLGATDNCGGCGTVCSSINIAVPVCSGGQCGGACDPGFADCDGLNYDGCETDTNDNDRNCGGCGVTCGIYNIADFGCHDGVCATACAPGYADCNGDLVSDGCETHIDGDADNCGACGTVCSSFHNFPLCSAGACLAACDNGYGDCDDDIVSNGCEADLRSLEYCGAGACPAQGGCSSNHLDGVACDEGNCEGTCKPGYADCDSDLRTDGCETPIYDASNCGGCGQVCSGANIVTVTCTAGACDGACQPGYADCDGEKLDNGCETPTTDDIMNCGACSARCSFSNIAQATCVGGVCGGSCNSGYADCNHDKLDDGCEVRIYDDAENCGGCGQACSTSHMASTTCNNFLCDGACAPGYADCNGDKLGDGCETPCASGVCTGGVCQATCTDNAKNGSETDIDCGGLSCSKCATGKTCLVNTDCTSGLCKPGLGTCG